jgi:hypothetical protein
MAWVVFAMLATPLQAATYSYDGQNFTSADGSTYTTSMSISGSFELALPLPTNLTQQAITPTAFSFFDGVQTRTLADSVICRFEVGTDSSGVIDKWNIYVMEDVALGNPRHTITSIREVTARDIGGIITSAAADDCIGKGQPEYGTNEDLPGTWMRTDVAAAPALHAWGILLLAALLVLIAASGLQRLRKTRGKA